MSEEINDHVVQGNSYQGGPGTAWPSSPQLSNDVNSLGSTAAFISIWHVHPATFQLIKYSEFLFLLFILDHVSD